MVSMMYLATKRRGGGGYPWYKSPFSINPSLQTPMTGMMTQKQAKDITCQEEKEEHEPYSLGWYGRNAKDWMKEQF